MEKQAKDDSYGHILKYTGLFGGVQGLSILVGVVRNKLVAMLLGPDGMGLMSLFNSTIKLVSDSTSFGLSMSAVKNVSEAVDTGDAERVRAAVALIRTWSLLTALLGMLVCVVLSPLLNRWTFTWGDHTLHFVMLSPVIALMAVTGGETAILKGARRLRGLAAISVCNVVLALVCSVPLYYFWGQSGVVPSLLLLALVQCLLTVAHSFRLFPVSLSATRAQLYEGRRMVRLGVAFVMAGVLGSGAEFVVRTYLNNVGGLSVVGLYNAGFMMTMTYAGMVFSAMETDYFPRLSGYARIDARFCQTVSHQVEVSLLLVAPLLACFMVLLPILLPMLYSGEFMPVIGMMRAGVLAMYFRALTLPVEYIALARRDSRSYLFLEAVYDVMFVGCVVVGYRLCDITGTGIGLAVAGLINLVTVYGYASWRYGYCMSASVLRYTLVQLPLGLASCLCCSQLQGGAYWVAGLLLALLSLAVSVTILHSKTNLWQMLSARLRSRLHLHP